MNDAALDKLKAKTAQEVCKELPLSEKARPLLKDGQTPAQFFRLLVEGGHLQDAIRFLASALPKREAVGWAYLAARAAHGDKAEAKCAAALEATRKWVIDPSEANRRTAEKTAKPAGYGTPAGCAALAAFLSGGSIAPADQKTPVQPAEHLCATSVFGAVFMSGVMTQPEKAPEKHRRFLDQGVEIAGGATPWM
jgi:hypothetical protein